MLLVLLPVEEKYCETTANIEYLSFGVMQVQGKKYVTIDVLPHVKHRVS